MVGLKKAFVLHGGSLQCDSMSCIGKDCKPGEYALELLHVQDQGFVKLGDSSKLPELQLNLVNFTVNFLSLFFCFSILTCILSSDVVSFKVLRGSRGKRRKAGREGERGWRYFFPQVLVIFYII